MRPVTHATSKLHVMLMQGHDITSCSYIVMFSHRNIMIWHHSWHHMAHAPGSIKGPAPRQEEIRWFDPHWVRRYPCMHLDWCTGAPTLTEPTSFKYNWLGCYNLSMCVGASADAQIHFEDGPGMLCSSFEYCLLRTVMPFGWCPCALFNELSSLHLQKRSTRGQDLPPHGAAHITYI